MQPIMRQQDMNKQLVNPQMSEYNKPDIEYDDKLDKIDAKELQEDIDPLSEPCETCRKRRYQDESNDGGVSFQSPQYVNPMNSGAVVHSHEREHYVREEAKALEEGKEVLVNRITLKRAVCEECGRTYVAGGETTTVTRDKGEEEENFLEDEPQHFDYFL